MEEPQDFSMMAPEAARVDWKVLDRRTILDAAPWLSVIQEQLELPSGRVVDDFYRIELRDFVVVVATDEQGRYVLVRGYKHGPRQNTLSPPAGLVEKSESPVVAARRELEEETGYSTESWRSVGSYVVDANRYCGTMYLFLATNVKQLRIPVVDEMESLEIVLMSRSQLASALIGNQITGLAAAAAIAVSFALYEAEV